MMCVANQTNLLAFDDALPNRDELLDVELMKNRLGGILDYQIKDCEIRRAKYQASYSLRVLYQIEAEKFVSARIYAGNPSRTDLFVFPNDRKVKNLNILACPPKFFPSSWKSSKVVAYAPEKCLTAACLDDSETIFAYAKIYAEKEFGAGEKVFRFLTEQTDKSLFPNVLGFDESNRILITKKVAGNCLANVDKSLNKHAFKMLGKAIGKLHTVKTNVNLPAFSRLSPERIENAVNTISFARPDCQGAVENLAEKLFQIDVSGDQEPVVLHGDVHPKNGILTDDGTLKLIDLDQLSYGNPAAEIGSFLAGLIYKRVVGIDSVAEHRENTAAFLQGYAEIRRLPNRDSINWHTAAALLTERASRSISRIRIIGLQNLSQILAAGNQILSGGEI